MRASVTYSQHTIDGVKQHVFHTKQKANIFSASPSLLTSPPSPSAGRVSQSTMRPLVRETPAQPDWVPQGGGVPGVNGVNTRVRVSGCEGGWRGSGIWRVKWTGKKFWICGSGK